MYKYIILIFNTNKVLLLVQYSYVLAQKYSFNGDNNVGNTESPYKPNNGGEGEDQMIMVEISHKKIANPKYVLRI
ncbi:hypothetical protein FHH43_09605 [Clostridium perfringens]|nr:hypothetical protein [Clostridium perfringens]